MNKGKIIILILFLIFVSGIVIFFYWFSKEGCFVDCDYNDPIEIINTVSYQCGDDETLVAMYGNNDYLDLKIYSKKETIELPRLVKSGSKYSVYNERGSVEFWSEGDEDMTTYLEENGIITHKCKFLSSGE